MSRKMSFSECLDEYLDMRASGPDESSGYTDKRYWQRLAELREAMDELAPLKPSNDEDSAL